MEAVPVSPDAGLSEAARYVIDQHARLHTRCPALARRVFETVRDPHERETVLHLLELCQPPASATVAQVDDAYARAQRIDPKGGLLQFGEEFRPWWMGYGNKLGASRVPPARHPFLRYWLYAAVILASDERRAPRVLH